MRPIRQGDVILLPIEPTTKYDLWEYDFDPEMGEKLPHLTLAEGEVTGHRHRICQGLAELYDRDGTLYLRVVSEQAVLGHEEHHVIEVPKGDWIVKIQREYEPDGVSASKERYQASNVWQGKPLTLFQDGDRSPNLTGLTDGESDRAIRQLLDDDDLWGSFEQTSSRSRSARKPRQPDSDDALANFSQQSWRWRDRTIEDLRRDRTIEDLQQNWRNVAD